MRGESEPVFLSVPQSPGRIPMSLSLRTEAPRRPKVVRRLGHGFRCCMLVRSMTLNVSFILHDSLVSPIHHDALVFLFTMTVLCFFIHHESFVSFIYHNLSSLLFTMTSLRLLFTVSFVSFIHQDSFVSFIHHNSFVSFIHHDSFVSFIHQDSFVSFIHHLISVFYSP